MVKRAKDLLDWHNPRLPSFRLEEEKLQALALRRADNIVWCSCYSCGNPRRHLGFTVYSHRDEIRTRQEILADLTFEDWTSGRDQ
jgi:hypothetical protein